MDEFGTADPVDAARVATLHLAAGQRRYPEAIAGPPDTDHNAGSAHQRSNP